MKKVSLLTVLLVLLVYGQQAFGQVQNQSFKMEGIEPESIILNESYTSSAEIAPFNNNVNKVFGLAITAEIMLNDQSGEVKIILVDKNHEEYLVYEVNELLVDEPGVPFTIEEICEETSVLNDVKVKSLRIEITNAKVSLKSISYTRAIRQGINFELVKKEKKKGQNVDKINRINEKLEEKGLSWVAGPTSVAELSYSEKKKLYGQSNFPAGIEYYSGGIITAGIPVKSSTVSMYVDEWDWRNRHGKNWITPVTNQGSCGSCWAFAVTGATEAMANVFYNQILNLDLSEQDILSCSGVGDCNGGNPGNALNYIMKSGIVDENCFLYSATELTCNNKSNNPSELVKIGGKIDFGSPSHPKSEDVLKRMLIEMGPISGGLYDWRHAMVLVGYKVVEEGDKFCFKGLDLKLSYKTVYAGDPLIGKTVWIFKNSWGSNFGDEGYVYVETPITNLEWTHAIITPIVSVIKNYHVVCEDADGDGYYWWGLGPKPVTCSSTNPADGNDADPNLGPLDQYGNCIVINGSPVINFSADKTVIAKGSSVNFTDLSTNSATSWSWSFSGGTPTTSSVKNPAVFYGTTGSYQVTLTATNSAGSGTKTVTNYIQVNEPVLAPVAEFAAAKTSLTIGESVQFNDLSTNSPTHWQWSFPGGTPVTSTLQKPVVTYKTAGQYDVTLVVSKDGFSPSEKIKEKYIATVENSPASYCVPVGINSATDYIQNVKFGTILSNSTTGSGYSISASTISLVPGKSYSIALIPKLSTTRNNWKLWIDFNGDGDFIDSGETLVSVGNKKGTLKTTIIIPQNATGNTRMRIAMQNGLTPAPCDGNYKGEVEDYPVTFGLAASSEIVASSVIDETSEIASSGSEVTEWSETNITAIKNTEVNNSNHFIFYPNPVTQILNIQMNLTQSGDFYTIYNINGEKVGTDKIISMHTVVDFRSYSPGIYLLRIVNGERVYNERIIKK